MTGSGIAAERQADGPVHSLQPVGLARLRMGDAGQRFGEGAARTGGIGAAEAPDADQQNGGATEARHITEAAPVGAVNAACRRAAAGAGHRGGNRLCTHGDPMKAVIDLIQDLKVGEKADRLQRDVQERDHDEGGFLPYGVPWPVRARHLPSAVRRCPLNRCLVTQNLEEPLIPCRFTRKVRENQTSFGLYTARCRGRSAFPASGRTGLGTAWPWACAGSVAAVYRRGWT